MPVSKDRASMDLGEELAPAALRASRKSSTVYIEVEEAGTRAKLTRGGTELKEIQVVDEAISSYLDSLVHVSTKVVSQSIKPGTAVPRGTVVDVTLAQVDRLPLRAVADVHPQLARFTVGEANTRLLTPEVKDILRRRTEADELTASEKSTVAAALDALTIEVTDEGPTSLANAYAGLQAAFQFAG